MNALIILSVVGLVLATVAYGIERWVSRPSPDSRLDARLAELVPLAGPDGAVAAAHAELRETQGHLATALDAAVAEDESAQARWRDYGAPVIAGKPLLAYVFFVLLLSVVAVVGFVVTRALDVGILETLGVIDLQAEVIGSLTAVATLILGLILVEALHPHAMTWVEHRRWRAPALIFATALFVGAILVMAQIAPRRAEARLGAGVAQAQAACADATVDPAASAAERLLVCDAATAKVENLAAAQQWDTLIAVLGPLAELLGSLGLVRALELLGAWRLARAARSRRRELLAARAGPQAALEAFVARVWRVLGHLRVPHEQVRAALARAGISEVVAPASNPPTPGAAGEVEPEVAPAPGVPPETTDVGPDRETEWPTTDPLGVF